MTLPSVIRIFFAIDLPPTAKEKIGNFIGVLKKSSRSHAIHASRDVRPALADDRLERAPPCRAHPAVPGRRSR